MSLNAQTINVSMAPARPAAVLRPVSWFLRRTLFGMAVLSVFTLGGAWLLYSSIEPDGATIAEHSQSE